MPRSLAHLETVSEIKASQVVLPPAERRASQAREQLVGSLHAATLAPALRYGNASDWIREEKRVARGIEPLVGVE